MSQQTEINNIYEVRYGYGNIRILKYIYLSETKNFYDVATDETRLKTKRISKETADIKTFMSLEEAVQFTKVFLDSLINNKMKDIENLRNTKDSLDKSESFVESMDFLGNIKIFG